MSTTPNYAEKIEALLAKAQDPAATPEEAETYTAKAEELMVKWGISDAILDSKRKAQRKSGEKIVATKLRFHGSFVRGEIRLGFAVGEGLGSVRVFKSNAPGEGTMVIYLTLVGFESDVARAVTLLESLRVQANLARTAWWNGKPEEERKSYAANEAYLAKRQFIITFAQTVKARLTATREQAVEQASKDKSTALVLVGRNEKLNDHMEANYQLKATKSRLNGGTAEAAAAGREAGKRANLGEKAVQGKGRKAVGS